MMFLNISKKGEMLWKKNYIRNYKSSDNNHTCDICFLAVWGDGDDSDRATAESP